MENDKKNKNKQITFETSIEKNIRAEFDFRKSFGGAKDANNFLQTKYDELSNQIEGNKNKSASSVQNAELNAVNNIAKSTGYTFNRPPKL